MFGLVVRFDLTEAGVGDFDDLAAKTLEDIRTGEPETLFYGCHRVASEPNARIFYELYADCDAFDRHESQPHVLKFLAERDQYFTCQPRVEFFDSFDGKGPMFGETSDDKR